MAKQYDHNYLNQQYSAMRWLAKQGLTPEEIQTATWGMVDECEKVFRICKTIYNIRYDQETGVTSRLEHETEIFLPIKGTGHEWFFLKSRFICPWIFTTHPPKTWRKEGSKEALFPVEQIEWACRGLADSETTNILTNLDQFARIRVSNLNFNKSKSEKEPKEAEVVK